MVRHWFASCLLVVGLQPLATVHGQTGLGSLNLSAAPPGSAAGEAEPFGWSRAGGVAAGAAPHDSGGHFRPRWWHLLRPQHPDPLDPARHVGLGLPLVGTSWRNRPFHAGWQFGGMFGDELVEDRIDQDEDMYGGYRLGWDYDHYWGAELRLGFANLDLTDTASSIPPGARTSQAQFWDVNLMYYPWGDARWRPFVSLGLGVGDFEFRDELLRRQRGTVLTIPASCGVKYFAHPGLAWRISLTDHWSPAAQGLATMHNVALTAGVEIHFGGTRVGYYPYRAGQQLW